MRKILVCQHVPHELLGTLNPLFKEAGFRIRYVNFGRHPSAQPSLEGYEGLVILGGPMNINEVGKYPHLLHEIGLINEAIANKIPVLGICLGAQLIAKALGGSVAKNAAREIGWFEVSPTAEGEADPLFRHFRAREKIFQWHEDLFSLPRDCVLLAAGPGSCQQAFRYGGRVYGLQFHLEVDAPMIERWLNLPSHQKALTAGDAGKIRAETPLHIEGLQTLSRKVFGEFLKLFGPEKKFRRLVSR